MKSEGLRGRKLAEDAFAFLVRKPGGAHFSAIARKVLRMKNVPPELAGRLVSELLEGDGRFVQDGGGMWSIRSCADAHWLGDVVFTVVDVETTGGGRSGDRVIEIGAFRVCGGRILDSFMTLVNPGVPVPESISLLTGIDGGMVRDAPAGGEVFPAFIEFLGDTVFAAHNATFDARVVNRELRRLGAPKMKNPVVCTMSLARRVVPGLGSYNLDALASHFGVGLSGERHRGHGDAWAAAKILISLLEELPGRDVATLESLLAFLKSPPEKNG
ncbi:MAG: exonuclease domain-containing protein [bacterium]